VPSDASDDPNEEKKKYASFALRAPAIDNEDNPGVFVRLSLLLLLLPLLAAAAAMISSRMTGEELKKRSSRDSIALSGGCGD